MFHSLGRNISRFITIKLRSVKFKMTLTEYKIFFFLNVGMEKKKHSEYSGNYKTFCIHLMSHNGKTIFQCKIIYYVWVKTGTDSKKLV